MKNKLKCSEIELKSAKYKWSMRHVDDEYVDSACISLMYSIECALKYVIEINGCKVPHTHSIKELLSELPDEYYDSDWYATLEKWKRVTDSWYNDSRYSDSFSAISKIVEDYFDACEKLISDVSDNVQYNSTVESKVQKVLNKLNSTKTVSEVLKYLPTCEVPDDVLFSLVLEILRDKLSSKSKSEGSMISAISKMSGD